MRMVISAKVQGKASTRVQLGLNEADEACEARSLAYSLVFFGRQSAGVVLVI